MKKLFSFLLMLFVGIGAVWADEYVKVTKLDDVVDGEYLIAIEDSNRIFNGGLSKLDVTNNFISVDIQNGKIESSEKVDTATFTLSGSNGVFTIKSYSGYYIGMTKDENNLVTNKTTTYSDTISFDNDGNVNIKCWAYLRYNGASNQQRFRFYKTASYTGQKAIQLYKKVSSSNPSEPTD